MIEVSYPPGAQDVVHRHDAHAFVYVLEGQIVMQLPQLPLHQGGLTAEGMQSSTSLPVSSTPAPSWLLI